MKICKAESVTRNKEILELKSKNAKITSEHESGSAEHVITKQELHDCEEELEDEIQKNESLQTQNSKSLKALEESRSSSSTNQRTAQECQNKLEDELEVNKDLKKKLEMFCPSWSEWSDCSQTCSGVRTRMDKCSINDEEIEPCNENCKGIKSAGSKLFLILILISVLVMNNGRSAKPILLDSQGNNKISSVNLNSHIC